MKLEQAICFGFGDFGCMMWFGLPSFISSFRFGMLGPFSWYQIQEFVCFKTSSGVGCGLYWVSGVMGLQEFQLQPKLPDQVSVDGGLQNQKV